MRFINIGCAGTHREIIRQLLHKLLHMFDVDFVLCMAWLPLWTFPGLVQASDELPFTQFFSYTLLMVLVICAPPSLAALSDRPL